MVEALPLIPGLVTLGEQEVNSKTRGFAFAVVVILVLGTLSSGLPAQSGSAALTNEDIVKMTKAGLSEALVIAAVRNAEQKQFDTSPEGLINLKKAGVSEAVIAVMMTTDGLVEAPRPPSREVVIPEGTEVTVRLRTPMSSATNRVGDAVSLEVVNDVVVNGTVVIGSRAPGRGEITQAQSRRSFGRSGKLNFTIDVVQAVNGENVSLRATRERRGGDSYGKAGVVTILAGPFGALVKGKDVEIPAGTEYVIYINEDRTIVLPQ